MISVNHRISQVKYSLLAFREWLRQKQASIEPEIIANVEGLEANSWLSSSEKSESCATGRGILAEDRVTEDKCWKYESF